jgi:hypothetical protein
MRVLLSSGLVFAGMVSIPFGVSPSQTYREIIPDVRLDPRLQTLRAFFAKANCPAEQYSEHFLGAANTYALDWRLLPSISFVESTGGKAARNNNFFGWNSGRAQFTSPEAAIYTVGFRLASSTLYRGKTLDDLLATYNPNADYARRVKFVMRQISPAE